MNAYTIFIQNNILVYELEGATYYTAIDIKVSNTESLLGLSIRTWKFLTGTIDYLPDMIQLKLMNHTGTGGLQPFKVNTEIGRKISERVQ